MSSLKDNTSSFAIIMPNIFITDFMPNFHIICSVEYNSMPKVVIENQNTLTKTDILS